MVLWRANLKSGEAQGVALINASTISEAKSEAFNQFLGIRKSSIIWDSEPTFWVVWNGAQAIQYDEEEIEA
jgi:hypothetical protein